ncbi:MAG TPA: hypothetical protein PKE30_12560 [Niabella sp.]|nr:hypothetical protein [Niabella sp.]
MPEPNVFLAPKLEGKRFENHALPLDMLEDLSALQNLIFEVAKKIYLEENSHRKRVPNGFLENTGLSIIDVKEGSTIPQIVISTLVGVGSIIGTNNFTTSNYLEKAKEEVLQLVSTEGATPANLGSYDEKIISYFNRLGRNLKDGEEMILAPNSTTNRAVLNQSVRKKILLTRSASREYSAEINEYATIPMIHKGDKEFSISIEGNEYRYKLKPGIRDVVEEAFKEFDNKTFVSIKATGIFDKNDKLIKIAKIESINVLDPFDVDLRIYHLKKIQDNWYYGEGKAPDHGFLDRFSADFGQYYGFDLPLPAIFPTAAGDIELEWSFKIANINFEINSKEYTGTLYVMKKNGGDDKDEEINLDLGKSEDWQVLSEKLKENIDERPNATA